MSYQHDIFKEDIEIWIKRDDESSVSVQAKTNFMNPLRKRVNSLNCILDQSMNEIKILQTESVTLRAERDRERKL